jgi:aldehyde:ferredoxin oxidoreductase
MIGGYVDKTLMVNLSDHSVEEVYFSDDIKRKFIGGYGFGAKYIYENQKPGVNPLSEDNIFTLFAGPLTGLNFPAVSRFTICGKSPLTNTWGDSNGSGHFGPELKFSGLDGIIIKGASEKPVYLLLEDGQIKIKDGSSLWGKDTYETEDILKEIHGKKAEIICIGTSGENLCLLSAVITRKGRAAARGGLGAVMGSKKIKAIVAIGSKDVHIADIERFKLVKNKFIKEIKNGCNLSEFYTTTGTPGYATNGLLSGDSPVKNWSGSSEDMKDFSELEYDNIEKYKVKRNACYCCPIACWGHVMINDGNYKLKEMSHMPEYETISAFGSYSLNNNFESIIKCNDICNRFGIDTISVGATVAFAINCFENNIISKKDTGGIELTWGNHKAIVDLTEKIANREGIGEILSNGVKAASAIIGKGSEEFAVHVQGQELPAHDSRFEPGFAVSYTLDATPGRHCQFGSFVLPSGIERELPEIRFVFDKTEYKDRAKAQRVMSSFMHIINTLGACLFGYFSGDVTNWQECYSAVTGWDVSLRELIKTGERIGTIRHLFNLREGITPTNMSYPKIAKGIPPLESGPLKGIVVDFDSMRKEYLEEMGWDLKTCIPSGSKLKDLELEDLNI